MQTQGHPKRTTHKAHKRSQMQDTSVAGRVPRYPSNARADTYPVAPGPLGRGRPNYEEKHPKRILSKRSPKNSKKHKNDGH